MPTKVKGASFVWTHGMDCAELHLTIQYGDELVEHNYALNDRVVLMLFDQMWRRRVDLLATQAAEWGDTSGWVMAGEARRSEPEGYRDLYNKATAEIARKAAGT